MRLPRISTSCSKSSAVESGAKRLHSIAKPRMPIRGLSLDTSSPSVVISKKRAHELIEFRGLFKVGRVPGRGDRPNLATWQGGGDRIGQESRKHDVLAAGDQQRRHVKRVQIGELARRDATQARAQFFLV